MSNSYQVSSAGTESKEPALATGLQALIIWAIGAGATWVGLPATAETKLIVLLAAGAVMPLAQALRTRFMVWSASSVARMRDDFQQLTREAASTNPPAIITTDPAPVGGYPQPEDPRAIPSFDTDPSRNQNSASTAEMGGFLGFSNDPRSEPSSRHGRRSASTQPYNPWGDQRG